MVSNRNLPFQVSIFRENVSFREGNLGGISSAIICGFQFGGWFGLEGSPRYLRD